MLQEIDFQTFRLPDKKTRKSRRPFPPNYKTEITVLKQQSAFKIKEKPKIQGKTLIENREKPWRNLH